MLQLQRHRRCTVHVLLPAYAYAVVPVQERRPGRMLYGMPTRPAVPAPSPWCQPEGASCAQFGAGLLDCSSVGCRAPSQVRPAGEPPVGKTLPHLELSTISKTWHHTLPPAAPAALHRVQPRKSRSGYSLQLPVTGIGTWCRPGCLSKCVLRGSHGM